MSCLNCEASTYDTLDIGLLYYYAATRRKEAVSFAFVRPSVCLSVCPSVAYIANNSRTRRPNVPKFIMEVTHL